MILYIVPKLCDCNKIQVSLKVLEKLHPLLTTTLSYFFFLSLHIILRVSFDLPHLLLPPSLCECVCLSLGGCSWEG